MILAPPRPLRASKVEISVNFLLRAEGRRGCFPCASGLGRAARVLTAVCRAHGELRLKCKRTDRTGTDRTQLKRVRACSSSLAFAWVTRCGRYSTLSRPLDAPRAPLTRRRRSDARRRHPRLRRRELHAARATARCRLDQVRHRHRTPTSALRTPARRRPSDRHSPRACCATAGASARAAAAALKTFSLNDEPEELLGARSRPAEPARQPADSHTRAFRRGAAALHSTVARVERVRVGRPP